MAGLSNAKSSGAMGACSAWAITSGVLAFVFVLAGLLAGFLVPMYVDDGLTQILVCDENSMGFDSFKSNRDANTRTYVTNILYNITNPTEVLLGTDTARIVESQQYVYRKRSQKFDIKFGSVDADGYETVTYKVWDQFTFDEERSCDGCTEHDVFYTMSIPYSGVLTSVVSEAGFLLTNECGGYQMSRIGSTDPVCETEEDRKDPSGTCACCAIAPAGNNTCVELLQPENANSAALLSYLGRMDRGAFVRDFAVETMGASALGDTHGVHSPVIVAKSAREILLGFASAIGGYGLAATTPTREDDTLNRADDFTSDYGTVCQALCGDRIAVGSQLFNADTCDAVIPDTNDELATLLSMSVDDVQKYSYLRKMSCNAYPWVAFGSLLAMGTPDAQCVDSNKVAGSDFCCLWSGTSPMAGPVKGFGCLVEVGGGLNERMMDTLDEARTFTAGTELYVREMRTGCGATMNKRDKADREAQTIVRYKTKSENPVWLDAPDATTRKMNPMDVRNVLMQTAPAVMLPVEGAYGAGVYPKGLTGDFFSPDVSDGEPLSKGFKVFPVTTRRGVDFKFDKTVTVNGIKGARFSFDYTEVDSTNENKAQGQGQPAKGLIAGFFFFASSVIMHEPLFAYGDHALLEQSDNAYLELAGNTHGVEILQTMSDYTTYAPLATPQVVTSSMLDEYEQDGSLLAYVVVEPATGNYIEGHNRIASSFQVWECDPRVAAMQGACAPMTFSGQCYTSTFGAPLPCSTANVLTPNLKGGKIIPVAVTDEHATISNEDADSLEAAGQAVYIARILMVVLCGLGVCLTAFTFYSYWATPADQSAGNKRKSLDAGVPENLASMYGSDDL